MSIIRSLEYNKQINPELQDIIEPLRAFGITTFAHSKYFDDGKAFRISSELEWSQQYYNLGFHNHPDGYEKSIRQHSSPLSLDFCLWRGEPTTEIYEALKSHNIWNGLTLCENGEGSISGWSFGTTAENESVLDFCLENIYLLKHFVLYMKSQHPNLLAPSDGSCFYTFAEPKELEESQVPEAAIQHFFEQTSIDKYCIDAEEKHFLTKREFDCLYELSLGKSAKQIAQALDISPRTVEGYLEKMKMRFNLSTKNQLAEMFIKHMLKWV